MDDFYHMRCYKCDQTINVNEIIDSKLTTLDETHYTESNKYPLPVFTRLNDILKGYVEINYPLCHECTDTLYEQLTYELSDIEKEIQLYNSVIKVIDEHENPHIEIDDKKLKIEEEDESVLNKTKLEEEELNKKLELLKIECQKLDNDYKKAIEESEKLTLMEKQLNEEYNQAKYQTNAEETEMRSLQYQLDYLEGEIEKWSKIDPITSVFNIKFENHFGIINGYRLGKISGMQNCNVPWNEINAAWGQTLLLLNSLSNKLGFKFKKYELVPLSIHSSIRVYEDFSASHLDKTQRAINSRLLPLYYTGGFKFFWDTKFDQAMLAFLECVSQMSEELERRDDQFKLPYKIDKGRLLEPATSIFYSIKAQFNSEENWTKALKYTLTNMQWLQTCIISSY
ncbi:unnamed protein product [Gordionus sp. m RMFG-2023]|uniref:beclin-1-like isoform X2 n=1 Tax=Gordionus sp. m RMFG-2023 TaxID=3053472 RepID=UPI0030DEA548